MYVNATLPSTFRRTREIYPLDTGRLQNVVLDVFLTSYVRSIYVVCPRGRAYFLYVRKSSFFQQENCYVVQVEVAHNIHVSYWFDGFCFTS